MSLLQTLRACYFLLPGHELDGFPRNLPSDDAQRLLSGWISAWDPRLIALAGGAPHWHSAEHPPEAVDDCLVIIPSFSESATSQEWLQRVETNGVRAALFRPPNAPWQECQDALIELVADRLATDTANNQVADPASSEPSTAESSSADSSELPPLSAHSIDWEQPLDQSVRNLFAALGYAFLQIELMTRQMRYTSNLDRTLFDEQVCKAARAALTGDSDTRDQMIQSCFDSLGQERDHYYSLDVNIVDITLLASTTLKKSLQRQLTNPAVTTFLASAQLVDELARTAPENLDALRERIAAGGDSVDVCGGTYAERPHPLMTAAALGRDLARGQQAYARHGLPAPQVFARFTYGMTPDDVAEIARAGLTGILMIAWSGGEYPTGSQSKILWESSDGTYLSTLASAPLDAADPASFLALGWRIGESLDHEHVPTLCLAHWPGRAAPLHELLRLVAKHTPALGVWRTASSYFAETDEPYHQERLSPHGFRYDWLRETSQPAALLNGVKAYHELHVQIQSIQNLASLSWLLANRPAESDASQEQPVEEEVRPAADTNWAPSIQHLWDQLDGLLDSTTEIDERVTTLKHAVEQEAGRVVSDLARHLLQSSRASSSKPESSGGELVLNPRSCPIRTRARTAREEVFIPESWRFSHGMVGGHRYTNIDVPGLGFVSAPLAAPGGTEAKLADRGPVLADEHGALRNEFLEAQIDPYRGHLRSLYVPHRRGNHLSVMLARRQVRGKSEYVHSEMVAQSVELRTSSPMAGLIRSTGFLQFDGKKCGEFEIDYEVWRGSRILEVAIRLSALQIDPSANPWQDAYILRLAWPTEAAILRTFQCGWRHSWPHGKAVSPLLVEIDEADYRTHFLCGGLAFHRREELRVMETLLTSSADDCEHRVGFSIDLPQPLQAASDFVDRRYSLPLSADHPVSSAAAWLVTLDSKNVVLDLEMPLVDHQGNPRGYRLLLKETQGKSTTTKVRLPYPVGHAARVNALGKAINRLTTLEDGFAIPLRANERCLVDVLWKQAKPEE